MLIDVEVIGINYTDVQTRSGALRQFRIIRLIDMRFLLPLLGLFFLACGDVEVPESIAPAQTKSAGLRVASIETVTEGPSLRHK